MDTRFWRLKNGISRLKLVLQRFIELANEDLRDAVIDVSRAGSRLLGLHSLVKAAAYQSGVMVERNEEGIAIAHFHARVQQANRSMNSPKPVIFVSACMDAEHPGGWKYNGGIKELNCLVKLLRQHGYEAYVVTYDGNYEPWLIDHQPHISLAEFRQRLQSLPNSQFRCVTSWAEAESFIQHCPTLYFWDMEVGFSENEHFPLLTNLYTHKIQNVAAISRTIQAWHMAYFRQSCILLPNLVDSDFWVPAPLRRRHYRVGYTDEGDHTHAYIHLIQERIAAQGLNLDFLQLQGSEAEMITAMQSCTVFLALNLGKDPLWGEGGPLPPLEALAAGCIPITFDILGPREIIQNGFNGFIVPHYRPDLMASALVTLYEQPERLEQIRNNASALFQTAYSFPARWAAVQEFLELPPSVEPVRATQRQEYAIAH